MIFDPANKKFKNQTWINSKSEKAAPSLALSKMNDLVQPSQGSSCCTKCGSSSFKNVEMIG